MQIEQKKSYFDYLDFFFLSLLLQFIFTVITKLRTNRFKIKLSMKVFYRFYSLDKTVVFFKSLQPEMKLLIKKILSMFTLWPKY